MTIYKTLDPSRSRLSKNLRNTGVNKLLTNHNFVYKQNVDNIGEPIYVKQFISKLRNNTNKPAGLCAPHQKYDTFGSADFGTMCVKSVHYVVSYAFKNLTSKDVRFKHVDPSITNKNNILNMSISLIGDFIRDISSLPNIDNTNFKCVIRNGSIYEIRYKKICFRDSLKLLLTSLKSLASSFNIQMSKQVFDYKQLTDLTNLQKIVNDNSLRAYNISDVIILEKVLNIMRIEIANSFDIEMNECVTLSSLAFKIFRKHHIKPYTLYKDGQTYAAQCP